MRKVCLFLMAVMDWHSKKLLSWRLPTTMNADFCVAVLKETLAKHSKPEIFNTDQSSQFTSFAFTNVLRENGISISMDGRGLWLDNDVLIEPFGKASSMNAYPCAPSKPARKPVRT